MAKRFNVDSADVKSWIKVLIYTVVTAIIIGVINVLASLELPMQYLWLAPLVNTVIVALKDFLTNNPIGGGNDFEAE